MDDHRPAIRWLMRDQTARDVGLDTDGALELAIAVADMALSQARLVLRDGPYKHPFDRSLESASVAWMHTQVAFKNSPLVSLGDEALLVITLSQRWTWDGLSNDLHPLMKDLRFPYLPFKPYRSSVTVAKWIDKTWSQLFKGRQRVVEGLLQVGTPSLEADVCIATLPAVWSVEMTRVFDGLFEYKRYAMPLSDTGQAFHSRFGT